MNQISSINEAPASLVDKAIQAVTGYMRQEKLTVGDPLPGEAHFANLVGVSRPVMREAFRAMAALKLVDVGNGRRPRVSAVDGTVIATSLNHAVNTAQITMPQVWDVRRTLELRTAMLAAAHRTDDEAVHLMSLARGMVLHGDDLDKVTQYDIAFHRAIAAASHNALFVQIISSFGDLMESSVPAAWSTRETEDERQATLLRHRDLAQAIADRDVASAQRLMDAHFDESVKTMLESMAGSPPPATPLQGASS